jgi:release factor glutamine methyltransferase
LKPRSKWPISNWAWPDVTVDQAVRHALALGLERVDAQWLLLHACARGADGRAWLLAHAADALPPETHSVFDAMVMRRLAGEPLAYITGQTEFYGLPLQVDARVLDPRADTETLVDWALEVMDTRDTAAPQRLIDLGTGSGAIALALKHERPFWDVHALDRSADALAVARANAQRLGLDLHLHVGDWLRGMERNFALIVANPPYIAAADPHLDQLQHEPLQALASGALGLDDLAVIVAQAPQHLAPGGWLLLEHGYDQADAVRTLLQRAGFVQVQSRRDVSGIQRCSGGQWPGL